MADSAEEFLPLTEVARRFNVSTETIKNWIVELGFPKGFYIGTKKFFTAFEVRLWQEQQKRNTEPPPKAEKPAQKVAKSGKRSDSD